MPAEPFLHIDRVSVSQGKTQILHEVSVSLAPGEFHGLLGPNGSGKTTLLRTLYFHARSHSGSICLNGKPQNQWPRNAWAQKVGVLVQGTTYFSGLCLRDIVEIGLAGSHTADGKRRIAEALEVAGLSGFENRPADQLSGGELQRAFIAQVLARDPDLYVLDEPTNHLDLHYQLILLDEVKRRGKTALVSLHDLSVAARYCDRVSILEKGRVAAQGPTGRVLTPEQLSRTYRIEGFMDRGALRILRPLK